MTVKHKIEIELVDGVPVVSNEMMISVLGELKVDVNFGYESTTETIGWDTCKAIYQAMVLASIGNVGKMVDSNTEVALSDDQVQKDIRIVCSVPGNVGLKEWVVRNQEEPKTMKDIDVIRDKIKSATLYKDIVIVAWEALAREHQV